MSDTLGPITIPDPPVISAFPLQGDFGSGVDFTPPIATHVFDQPGLKTEQRYLMGLANFRPEALVERTLGLTLDGTVRTQDGPFLLRALLMGVHSRAQAWAFFRAKWEQMASLFPGPGIRRLCEGVLGLTSAEWEQQVQTFFRARNINLGGKTLEQFLEQLHIAVVLRQREGQSLRAHLRREAG